MIVRDYHNNAGMSDLGKFKFKKILGAVAPLVSVVPGVGAPAAALLAKTQKPKGGGGSTTIINQAAPAARPAAAGPAAAVPFYMRKPVMIGAGVAVGLLVLLLVTRK